MDLKLWGKYSEFNIYFRGPHWVFPLIPFLFYKWETLVYEYRSKNSSNNSYWYLVCILPFSTAFTSNFSSVQYYKQKSLHIFVLKIKTLRYDIIIGIRVVDQFLNPGPLVQISVSFLMGHAEDVQESNSVPVWLDRTPALAMCII